MIISDLLTDIVQSLQADFPSVHVQVGRISAQTDRVTVSVSAEAYTNARSREPLGDSPLAPGDYEVGVRFEMNAPANGLPASYEPIEAIYLWSQSQQRRHTLLYHYSLPTTLQFAVQGDVLFGWWVVTYRLRRVRG